MHVLTKIFIVLVSLLAVLLVPLVVVYAHNEDSYKAKYQDATASAALANRTLNEEQAAFAQRENELQLEIQELTDANEELTQQRQQAEAEIRQLQINLREARAQQAGIRADLATISSAVDAGQALIESLLAEVREMRTEALAAERRSVELDEALRDVSGQLQSAVAARRALQEELQQLREEHAEAMEEIAAYVEKYGRLDPELASPASAPTVDLDATVVRVSRESEQTLAEINAGSRDGVKEGWKMTVGRGGKFVATLRIIAVDINRSTGVVELEDPDGRGRVEAGDRVYARRGS